MNKERHIAVLIPAAGTSSRMGEPKQLLKWKDTSLLGHAVRTAESLKVDVIAVILGAFSERIKAEISSENISIYFNQDWKKGLGSSIGLGLQQLLIDYPETDAVLIMLADQPMIDSSYLEQILNTFKANDAPIVASTYSDEHFGVPAIFDKRIFNDIVSLDSEKGAKDLINSYRTEVLSISEVPNLVDIDTKDQYEQLYNANHQS